MPQLGLGLGLDKSRLLSNPLNELIKDLQSAGAVLALVANYADGKKPLTGNTSPWVDLSGNLNNGTLTNISGSASSGWNTDGGLPLLTFDGVDDFVQFVDTASLNITTAPLAIGVTIKNTDVGSYIICKNEDAGAATESQYALFKTATNKVDFYLNSSLRVSATIDDTKYANVLMFWDGVNIFTYVNGILDSTNALVTTLTSYPHTRIGCRSASIDGTVNTSFVSGNIATTTVYTGSDINKILATEAKLSSPYLALNL